MGNTFGKIFRVTTFGESHGAAIGAVIDGCPPRLPLSENDIQAQMNRRRPGQSAYTTARKESDRVRILSGVEKSITLGSPIMILIENEDTRANDYEELQNIPRPSHADFTYRLKYGVTSTSGGGRASARETAARVAAGAVAEKFLKLSHNIQITAWVSAIEDVEWEPDSIAHITREIVDKSPVRCPEPTISARMEKAVAKAKNDGDSVGGIISCICRNVPAGLGEPVFDKAHALLGAAMLSIPACRAFEIGDGIEGSRMRGSVHNDLFVKKENRIGTETNRSGGIQGGITNGEDVFFRVAFKPTATIRIEQKTVDYDGNEITLPPSKGRHDPCVLPRAVPVVESMAALVLADLILQAGMYK